eukprot:gb/GECG01003537.1/.p1 GENE.gb/GECG01003537.1/~~gb/GECG01003537.1/.p1  ORF type:complete len:661 (+),score=106.01 gb/GECG01003537.1/:1-1983(+)
MPKAKFAHRGKAKPKSVKSTAKLTSKRKLSRFGKEQKKGHAGTATSYMTRTRAIKKLQIPLKDFRRLCILKGIYPRDPKVKPAGRNQTYYHIKDIQYLMHEPLLDKFRELKAFMKKVRRAAGKDQVDEARRLYSIRPTYNLDHLVRERYPNFQDALGDLDDALTLMNLFAALPAIGGRIKAEHTTLAQRLCKEWEAYVAKSKSLRKVFFSLKGVYYQVEVHGVKITWLVPYKFTQEIPEDVDYRIMQTFLEFYQVLMKFVMFKLYNDMNLKYPPALDDEKDAQGGHLSAVKLQRQDTTHSSTEEASGSHTGDDGSNPKQQQIDSKVKQIVKHQGHEQNKEEESEEANVSAESDSEEEIEGEEENADSEAIALRDARKERQRTKKLQKLFRGLTFFLGRETPVEALEFIIRSFGGKVGWDGPGSPIEVDDPSITHQVTDRPTIRNKHEGREYIQPQWVADSVNAQMCLPIHRYAPGAFLPPHLSPFVDDASEGYVPAYRRELDTLRAASGVISQEEAQETVNASDSGALGDEGNSQPPADPRHSTDEAEEDHSNVDDSKKNSESIDQKGNERVRTSLGKLGRAPNEFVQKGQLLGDDALVGKKRGAAAMGSTSENEKRELAASMLSSKKRRQYDVVQRSVRRSANYVQRLQAKRKKVDSEE